MTIDETAERLGKIVSSLVDACAKSHKKSEDGYVDVEFDIEDGDEEFLIQQASLREITVNEFLTDLLATVLNHVEESEDF